MLDSLKGEVVVANLNMAFRDGDKLKEIHKVSIKSLF